MKKYSFLIGFLGILLIVGAGCKPSSRSNTATSTPEEALVDTTIQQEAYLFCTQKGHDIQIRFVSSENRNVAYCVFADKTECESIAFMNGTCPKAETATSTEDGEVSMFEPSAGDAFPLRLCDPIAKPVCGKDNKTYTNACIAHFLEVEIAREGTCDRPAAEEETETPPTVDTTPIPSVPDSRDSSRISSRTSSGSQNKNWVEIPASLLKSSTNKNSSIERCEWNNTVTFLVKTDCPNCFSTLYNATGEVMCYPDHDISESCPEYITSSGYKNSCKRVSQ